MKKLIDFEKLKEIRYLCSKCDKLVCEKFGCPIWNSLPDLERVRSEGWISVKERLPDKNIAVIVHISNGDIDVRVLGICDDDPNGLWYCYKGVGEPLHFNDVTHWRPLPEPPRGE